MRLGEAGALHPIGAIDLDSATPDVTFLAALGGLFTEMAEYLRGNDIHIDLRAERLGQEP